MEGLDILNYCNALKSFQIFGMKLKAGGYPKGGLNVIAAWNCGNEESGRLGLHPAAG